LFRCLRLAGTGIPLYAMTGNDDPPELQGLLRDSPVLTETEEGLVDLGEGITMLSFGYSNPTPWHTPRELPDDELFSEQWVRVPLSPSEFPGYKGERLACARCGEGINFKREVVKDGRTLCRSCAGERYYEAVH